MHNISTELSVLTDGETFVAGNRIMEIYVNQQKGNFSSSRQYVKYRKKISKGNCSLAMGNYNLFLYQETEN